ncbi:MAG TPA: antibiotic biosynthesis monooxygenase [Ktedonobacteraceae bacterium]|nr:antibiotic biosynthesis monooxygenase [Ktedonobacteraceae bacterium]
MDSQLQGPIALINVHTVEPKHQQEVLDITLNRSLQVARRWPGFISARYHVALDKTRVTQVIYWENQEACLDFIKDPGTQEVLKQFAPLVQQTESHFYTVVADVVASQEALPS